MRLKENRVVSESIFTKYIFFFQGAMEKKSLSKPMKEILSRIAEFEYITTIIFPEDVILNVSFN